MGTIVILFVLAFCGNCLTAPSPKSSESEEKHSKLAQYCNEELCKLPNCRCSSTILNETIPVEDIPQVNILFYVLITPFLHFKIIKMVFIKLLKFTLVKGGHCMFAKLSLK